MPRWTGCRSSRSRRLRGRSRRSVGVGDAELDACVYDAADAGAVHLVAERNGLPLDAVVPVMVLSPYFYR